MLESRDTKVFTGKPHYLPIWCANRVQLAKDWVLEQEEIFLYLFIYVIPFLRAENPSPQLN